MTARKDSFSARVMDAGLRDRFAGLGWQRAGAVSCTLEGDGVIWKFVLVDRKHERDACRDSCGAEILRLDDIAMEALGYRSSHTLLGTQHRVHVETDIETNDGRRARTDSETKTEDQPGRIYEELCVSGFSGRMSWTGYREFGGEVAAGRMTAEEHVAERIFHHWQALVWPRIQRAMDVKGVVDEFMFLQKWLGAPELLRDPFSARQIIAKFLAGDKDTARDMLQFGINTAARPYSWHRKRQWARSDFWKRVQMFLPSGKAKTAEMMAYWQEDAELSRRLAEVMGIELGHGDGC